MNTQSQPTSNGSPSATPALVKAHSIFSFSVVDNDLCESVVDKASLRTVRGLQLHLLALAEKRYGKSFQTKPDSSLCGFRVVADNGECLGIATGAEMGVLP